MPSTVKSAGPVTIWGLLQATPSDGEEGSLPAGHSNIQPPNLISMTSRQTDKICILAPDMTDIYVAHGRKIAWMYYVAHTHVKKHSNITEEQWLQQCTRYHVPAWMAFIYVSTKMAMQKP